MATATPTSVILPTQGWSDASEEIAAQLEPADELLVVCDDTAPAVVDRIDDYDDSVRLVIADDPEGCSGKANAIAAGMEAAEHDRLVWTDDDFHHPPDWLARLRADYDRHGPTSELPVFVGQDPLAAALEPLYALSGTVAVFLADIPWAGSLVFERADLDDEAAFLEALRQTISDDGLLMEHVDFTTVKRTRHVETGGSIRETLETQVRFTQIVYRHDPTGTATQAAFGAGLAAGCLLFPLPALALVTLLVAGVYATFGIRRWTFFAAYPVAIAAIPLLVYGLARRSFVWGGRRYRWHDKFDVTVEPE
ncbi:glycosyltransferase [Natronorubrum thiooxidans]|uniref:Glycosyl transferase family 21 n=1 Tax=Natronorubrum thiooxidans TaxID=308853 RepID=A0A1N7DF50_9EURY|nr:glycosyltransferase [Natronorubrum thiooxidans]SIR74414.1 Glycosyl transferase family 21 [Natronorubrum thiooxidans]